MVLYRTVLLNNNLKINNMILLILYYFITVSIAFGIDWADSSYTKKDVFRFRNVCENVFLSPFLFPIVLGIMLQTIYENVETLKNK